MNIDAFIEIGELHRGSHCEDYFYFNKDKNYMLLSDGCSSSPHTDIGSRILIRSAKHIIDCYSQINLINLPVDAVEDSFLITKMLGLSHACLDATLLSAMYDPIKKEINFSIAGDGFVFWKDEKGIVIIQIEYSENAPYYPSVMANKSLEDNWKQVFPQNKMLIKQYGDHKLPIDTMFNEPDIFNGLMPSEGIEFFGLSTDGLASFVNNMGQLQPIETVFNEVLAFKNKAGSFVQRRMNRMMKDYKAQNIIHADDVSVVIMDFTE